MSKKCNCYICKFTRGELSVSEILDTIEDDMHEYLYQIRNTDNKKSVADWSEIDWICHAADESGCLLDLVIQEHCNTKKECIRAYNISLALNDIHREYYRRKSNDREIFCVLRGHDQYHPVVYYQSETLAKKHCEAFNKGNWSDMSCKYEKITIANNLPNKMKS